MTLTEAVKIVEAAGLVVVPKEPDKKMRFAGSDQIGEWAINEGSSPQWERPADIDVRCAGLRAKAIYRAMLAARPEVTEE